MVQLLWKTVRRFLKKLKIELPYDPAIPPGHISGKNYNLKRYMSPMFIAALFTIAKTWKQPKCPSTDEWIKKMWYIHTMEYYSASEWSEILTHATTWMNLETMLSKISQTPKDKYCMISLISGTKSNP